MLRALQPSPAGRLAAGATGTLSVPLSRPLHDQLLLLHQLHQDPVQASEHRPAAPPASHRPGFIYVAGLHTVLFALQRLPRGGLRHSEEPRMEGPDSAAQHLQRLPGPFHLLPVLLHPEGGGERCDETTGGPLTPERVLSHAVGRY